MMRTGARGRVAAVALTVLAVGGLTAATASSGYGLAGGAPAGERAKTPSALLVQAEAAAGFAAPGNTLPADILVLVTDPVTGQAAANLTQANLVVINHFSHPGQSCGFSNNIVGFDNVGTGAYHVQVAPVGCTWSSGDFLLQVLVASGVRKGQAAASLTITAPTAAARRG